MECPRRFLSTESSHHVEEKLSSNGEDFQNLTFSAIFVSKPSGGDGNVHA
jgi:hypothetical protein